MGTGRPSALESETVMTENQRFLCDEMLHRLGRYLRMAGYNTRFSAKGEHDNEVLRCAAVEDRWLLTLDTKIFSHSFKWHKVFLLSTSRLNEQVEIVSKQFSIDWLSHAFTRCIVDNTPLAHADGEQKSKLPEGAQTLGGPVLYCNECHRLYWQGSHFEKMLEQLRAFNEKALLLHDEELSSSSSPLITR